MKQNYDERGPILEREVTMIVKDALEAKGRTIAKVVS